MGVNKYVTTWIPVVLLNVCILGFKYHTVAALQAHSNPTRVYYHQASTQKYCFEGSPHKPKYCIKLCPRPGDIMNGKVEFSSIMEGGVATYRCNSGYGLVGSSSQLTCHRSGGWSDSPPRCYKLVQCPEVNDPTNGSASIEHRVRGVGDIVEYTCSSGYDLVGSSSRTCLPDGTWTENTPQCIRRVCPVLDPPSNGSLVISTYIVNGNALYSCNSGYQLVGSSKRNCLSTGSWSNSPPTCNRVCPRPNSPIHGLVLKLGRDPYPSSFFVGDRARYGCYYGFGLKGPHTLTCLSDGRWSGPSPRCDRTCYSLKDPKHGTVNVSSYLFGDFAHYTCDTGYVLKGLSDRRCESNGLWSGMKPVCRSVKCHEPSSPHKGFVTVGSYKFGAVAWFSCLDGHQLVGFPRRTCMSNGIWSGVQPFCTSMSSGSGSGSESGSGDCNCLNGGSCYFDDGIADLEDGGMACNCPPGFRGDKCQDAYGPRMNNLSL